MKLGFEETQAAYSSGSQSARVWTESWVRSWAYCPHCGARHMSPYESEDLTAVVEQEGSEFVVLESPDTAEHNPDYRELGRFATEELANKFVETDGL